MTQRLLEMLIVERVPRILLEGGRGGFHGSQTASPIAGTSVMPASTSAT
jgi:hypothetical protein